MGFHIMHRDGGMDVDPPFDAFPSLLDELERVDDEHPEVAIGRDGDTLSVFASGLVVFENVESDDPPKHVLGLERSDVLALMTALAEGRLADLDRIDWRPGYGP